MTNSPKFNTGSFFKKRIVTKTAFLFTNGSFEITLSDET